MSKHQFMKMLRELYGLLRHAPHFSDINTVWLGEYNLWDFIRLGSRIYFTGKFTSLGKWKYEW